MREKSTGVYFKMSPAEAALFERRMAQTGIRNRSAFIRKMCIDGHVIQLDLATLGEIGRLLRITANNVNQIAHRVNAGGRAYREDVAEVNRQLAELRADFGKLLDLLAEFDGAKLGRHFIPPPTDENPAKRFEEERTSNGAKWISPEKGDVAERSL